MSNIFSRGKKLEGFAPCLGWGNCYFAWTVSTGKLLFRTVGKHRRNYLIFSYIRGNNREDPRTQIRGEIFPLYLVECFLVQESTDRKCLGACLVHSMEISLVFEYHHHPSVRHFATNQSISLGQKIVRVYHLEKHLMEQVVYHFWCKKEHQFFVTIKADGSL